MTKIIQKRPTASVIIDNYNFGQFIGEAIESILNQKAFSLQDIEIIVVDDGSTDDTKERVKKYKDKIKYIYKYNGGQGSALNTGFEISKGEVIFLLDSDDIFYPEKIGQVCEIYNKHNYQAVFNLLVSFGEGIQEEESLVRYTLQFLNNVYKDIYKLNYKHNTSSFIFLSQTSGQSYRRELFEKLYPIPVSYKYAVDLYLQAMALLYEDIYYIDKPLTKYRQHSQSFMGMYFEGNLERKISEINFIYNTIDILKKQNNNRAEYLIKSLQNKIYYLGYNLEKYKGNKLAAFAYMLKYKPSPKKAIDKTIRKADYIFDLILPDNLYKFSKEIYRLPRKLLQ